MHQFFNAKIHQSIVWVVLTQEINALLNGRSWFTFEIRNHMYNTCTPEFSFSSHTPGLITATPLRNQEIT